MAEEIKEEVVVENEQAVVQENIAEEVKTETKNDNRKKPKKDFKKDGRRRDDRRRDENDKALVSVRRVTKVVKGGRTMRFSAMVVVGDRKGKIGIGIGKGKEVPLAIDKATSVARRHMKPFNVKGTTIEHEVVGKYGKSSIMLMPAKEGTGIIAGGSARAVLELAGIKDIVTKIHGSTNKINVVKATLDGLSKIKTKAQIAEKRNKLVEDI